MMPFSGLCFSPLLPLLRATLTQEVQPCAGSIGIGLAAVRAIITKADFNATSLILRLREAFFQRRMLLKFASTWLCGQSDIRVCSCSSSCFSLISLKYKLLGVN